jgi:hypothetical protein
LARLTAWYSQDGTKIYTAVVNCVNLKRDIRIAYLVKNTASGLYFACKINNKGKVLRWFIKQLSILDTFKVKAV